MDKYIFSAVFDPCEEGGYSVTFPDLPGCITEGDTLEEAFQMARDALMLHLWGMEEEGDPIPDPTSPQAISAPEGGFVSLIEVWMVPFRDKMANEGAALRPACSSRQNCKNLFWTCRLSARDGEYKKKQMGG